MKKIALLFLLCSMPVMALNYKSDIDSINAKRAEKSQITVQEQIEELKERKKDELELVEAALNDKTAQLNKINSDTKLTSSSKVSKTSLLKKEISTLQTKKTNIENKYNALIKALE